MQLSVVSNDPAKEPEPSFAEFWRIYPRRLSRAMAERCFAKLPPEDKVAAIAAIPAHIAFWRENASSIQYVPHASTWLNQRRWEDELETALDFAPQKKADFSWKKSDAGILAKAREVGVTPHGGETWPQLIGRIEEKLRHG